MRTSQNLLSRALARFGLASKKKEEQRINHSSRTLRFEPLERRQLLSVVTWTGLGANNYWGTAANWSTNAAPTAGDDLVFTGSTRTATVNNLSSGTPFNSLAFRSNNFSVSGNSLGVLSSLVVNAGVSGTSISSNLVLYGSTLVNVNSSTLTISSVVSGISSGVGGINKTGAGTLILTGANTYTGGTTISAGALQLGAGGATGSIVGNILNNSQLIVNQTGSLSLNGTLSGTGSLTKSGSGTLSLAGNNYFFGGTMINAGTVKQESSSALGYGNLTMAGGILDLNGHDANVTWLTGISGGSIANSLSSATATLYIYESGSFEGSIVNDLGGNVAVHFVGGNGNGSLYLSGYNNYWGGTTIDSGTVTLGNSWGLGYGNVTINAGTLDLNGNDLYIDSLDGSSSALVTSNGGDATLSIWNGGSYAGAINDGYGVISLYSSGNLYLGNGNFFSGGTTVSGGTLTLGTDVSLGYGNVTMYGGTLNLNDNDAYFSEIHGSANSVITNSTGVSTLYNWHGGDFYGTIADGGGQLGLNLSGSLFLTGTNTYTGGTTISSGTLEVGSGGTTGSIVGNVVNYGNLLINRSNSFTFSGAISGSGSLVKYGSGTLILTGANTFTGDTYINSGTLQIGAGGTTGSIVGNISSGGQVIFNRSDNVTYGGVFSGGGSLTKSGSGTLILTGANTYSGGTTITAGALQLGNNSATGSIVGDIVDNGQLIVSRTGSLTLSGVISGSGSLTQSGSGSLTLSNFSSYTGGTTIAAGTLQLGAGGRGGGIDGAIQNNGQLVINHDYISFMTSVISGSGSLTKVGSGAVYLTGANTYTGGTTVSGGKLTLGANSATGSIVGNVVNNGVFGFDHSDDFTFAGVISGNGSVEKYGNNTVIFTGTNTYTGGTTISSGTLQLGTGGTTGSIVGNIVDNGALVVNRSNVIYLNGVISGSGSLSKYGYCWLSLGGANTYTGGTYIDFATISLGTNTALGTGAVTVNGTIDLNGHAPTIRELSGKGGIYSSNSTTNAALYTVGTSTFAGVINGASYYRPISLVVSSGTLTLTGANTFTGGTTVASSATLQLGGGSLASSIVNNGTVSFINSGSMTLDVSIANSGTINLANSGKLTLNGVISGSGSVIKTGTGETVLSGANTNTGGIYLSAGLVTLGGATALGAGSLTIDGDARLDMNGFNNASQPLTSVLLVDGYIIDGSLAANSAFNLQNGLVTANLVGSAGLTKSGSGTVTLTGVNTYLGSTVAIGGVLIVGTTQSLPPGTVVTEAGGIVVYTQTLYWNGGNGAWNSSYAWHYSDGTLASWVDGSNAVFSGGGTITISGSVNALSMTFVSGNYAFSGGQISVPYFNNINTGSGTVIVSSALSGAGVIEKTGAGELKFNGTSTFAGAGWMKDGTFNLDFSAMPSATPDIWIDGDDDVIGPGSLHFSDSTVYSDVHAAFADETIDRNETLAILQALAARGTSITAAAFSDLQTLANNPTSFNMLDYVHVLLSDVAIGNTANAHYQGQTLGNLAAGSTSTQLTNLTNKWFLGLDRPTGSGTYTHISGSLANADGFTWDDMKQSSILGDCWFIAGMGALGNASQEAVSNMFIDNGDGTWTLRFYGYNSGVFTADYVTVDQYLPTNSSGVRIYAAWTNGLWIALAEKAFAQWCETGKPYQFSNARGTTNAYSSLYAGTHSEIFSAALGRGCSSATTVSAYCSALDNGYAVGFSSPSSLVSGVPTSKYGLYSSHAYTVIGYYYDSAAADYRFIVKNPWGTAHPTDILGSDIDYLTIANPDGTTPAESNYATAPLYAAASTASEITSTPLTFADPKSYAPHNESTFSRFASPSSFNSLFESKSSSEETRARTSIFASLFDDTKTHINSSANRESEGTVASDGWLSDGPLTTFAENAETASNFETMRRLRDHKKTKNLDNAVDSVLAESDAVLVLL